MVSQHLEENTQSTQGIYGRRTVLEALRAQREIEKIFFAFGAEGEGIDTIRAEAKRRNIPCSIADRQKFAMLEKRIEVGDGAVQGVIALMPLYRPITLEQAIEQAYTETDNPVFVLLDGIHDPHNVGAIARSVACAGAHALVVPTHHGSPITSTAMKSSAGALHHISIVKVPNTSVALKDCKAAGFTIIGTDMHNAQSYDTPDYDMPTVLVIGSEGSGMKPETRKLLDLSVTIPLSGQVQSLNASVAAGIILFEIKRKKAATNSQ